MSLRTYVKGVVSVSPRTSIEEASRAMRDHQIGAVVVTSDDGKPLGLLTDRDVAVRVVAEGSPAGSTPVEEVMTREPTTLSEDDTLERATQVMSERGVRRLPILDREGRVAGIVSLDDVVLLLGMELGNVASAIFSGMARPGAPRAETERREG